MCAAAAKGQAPSTEQGEPPQHTVLPAQYGAERVCDWCRQHAPQSISVITPLNTVPLHAFLF